LERALFYETGKRDKILLPRDPFKAIVAPRPIGWISTRALDGRVNLAPYSFFNGFNSAPPIVGFSSEGDKDSVTFARESGEYVANFASFDLLHAISQTSAPLPRGQSEFAFAGLSTADCKLVKAPRVAASYASLECKVADIIPLKTTSGRSLNTFLVLGEVVAFHIEDRFIRDGRFDLAAAKAVARCGYQDYAVVENLIALARPAGGGHGA
jgi:flavin reductase (DIM6/NTAB) family NADH-FMN oxidoreductase RutF